MAKWGKADFRQFRQLQEHIEAASERINMDAFCKACCKELAARLLGLVIPRTPVGEYKGEEYTCKARGMPERKHIGAVVEGKKGGTLRRGWTGSKSAGAAYAQNLPIAKTGHTYTIEVINPVEYASYVESGHRQEVGRYVPAIGKKLKKGYVEEHYMLKFSEQDLERLAPAMLQRKLDNFLREVFHV